MTRETRKWVRKAESDFRQAKLAAGAKPPIHDGTCFHCQQCAEKYAKAFLQEAGVAVPRTHDLVKLLAIALPHDSTLRPLKRGMAYLTDFAVDVRYPEADPTARQARSSLRWMERVREEIRTRLGLKN